MATSPPASARVRRVTAGWVGEITAPSRLLMATKAAFAAALAWFLAPLLPVGEDQYSYYAPLGVLVSMHPTISASARSGGQALIGLALGIALGAAGVAAVFAGAPGVVTLAAVVLIGVLLGGVRALGEGRSWVAMAALFVLLLSGRNVEDFSVSYVVMMAFGVAIGVAVNFLIFPPLSVQRASTRLSVLRDAVSSFLTKVADDVREGTVNADTLDADVRALDDTATAVRAEVHEADESRRANPRARRHRTEQEENLARLQALERVAFYTRDFSTLLTDLSASDDVSLSRDVRLTFADAIRSCAALVATPIGAEDSTAQLDKAESALTSYLVALRDASPHEIVLAPGEFTAGALLRRIIDASRPFIGTRS